MIGLALKRDTVDYDKPESQKPQHDYYMRDLRLSIGHNPTVDLGVRNWIEDRLKSAVSQRSLVCEIVTITPQLARELLLRNDGNRPLRRAKFDQLVSDIRNGRWRLNGESVIINRAGNLDDGQHRCLAAVETDTAITSVMVFGTDPASRLTLDSGANRSAGDLLAFEGVPYAPTVAGVARFLLAYERSSRKSLWATNQITLSEVLARGLADAAIVTSITATYQGVKKLRRISLLSPSIAAFLHYIFALKSKTDADEFMAALLTGTNLKGDAPAYHARERLLATPKNHKIVKVEIVVRAWNHYRRGESVKGILLHPGRIPSIR